MFLLVQMYDVLDTLHIRVRLVHDAAGLEPLTATLITNLETHWPSEVQSDRDFVAFLGEQLLDVAHSDTPLL